MILMEKDGHKELVFDCFIPRYRANGWKTSGEIDDVQFPPKVKPEHDIDETAIIDSTAVETDSEVETIVKSFVCPYCDNGYSKESSLKTHIKRNHAEK